MQNYSYMDAAYEALTEEYVKNGNKSIPMSFGDLLLKIASKMNLTESDLLKIMSKLYTELTIDGRFVIKEDNTWVLREHEKFSAVHIDMNAVYGKDNKNKDEDENEESENNSENDDDPEKEDETDKDEIDGEEDDSDPSIESEFNDDDDQ